MGREIKRVAAGFNWPLDKVYDGLLMPERLHSTPCEACGHTGYNPETKQIADSFYDLGGFGVRWAYEYGTAPDGTKASRPPWRVLGATCRWVHDLTQDEVQALVDADRLWDLTRTFVPGKGWQDRTDGHVPTAEEVNAWSQHGMGHDGINRFILIRTRAERLGVYGHCAVCDGEGSTYPSDAIRAEADAWEATQPPTGDWWQVWETVSEGSPVTPAFATAAELVDYLVANGDAWDQKRLLDPSSWLGRAGWDRAAAAKFVGNGWAPTMISTAGRVLMPGDAE